MKIKLDENTRKFLPVEIELDENVHEFKYYEKTTAQIKELKTASKDKKSILEIEEINEEQFFENFQGDKETLNKVIQFLEEKGNFYTFLNECDKNLGKLLQAG